MSTGKIIAVIGAPRSGKTFLVNKLTAKLAAQPFLEEIDNAVPKFIEEDIKDNQNCLRRILWFRNRQISHFLEAAELKKSGKIILLDTFWIDYQMYIDVLLQGIDQTVAHDMADLDLKNLTWPDVIIYLKNDENGTKKFIELGGRDYDTGNYYQNIIAPLQKKYEKILSLVPPNTKLIVEERSDIDFEKDDDLNSLTEKILS